MLAGKWSCSVLVKTPRSRVILRGPARIRRSLITIYWRARYGDRDPGRPKEDVYSSISFSVFVGDVVRGRLWESNASDQSLKSSVSMACHTINSCLVPPEFLAGCRHGTGRLWDSLIEDIYQLEWYCFRREVHGAQRLLYSWAIRNYSKCAVSGYSNQLALTALLTRLSWSTLGMLTIGRFTGVVRSFPETCYTDDKRRRNLHFSLFLPKTDKFSSVSSLARGRLGRRSSFRRAPL